MLVEASRKDSFGGSLLQTGVLPAAFYYGARHAIKHVCISCGQEVEALFGYGSKQMVELGDMSRQGFNENRAQLDVVGKLFGQYLYHEVDMNGFESYLYQSDPDEQKGAMLNVAYYRCPHCQAQYLVSYQDQLKEDRPPFEPDEILIDKVFRVEFDHNGLLQALGQVRADAATE